MKQLLLTTVISTLVGLGSASYAQAQRQQQPSTQEQQNQGNAEATTLTGCLTKGSTTGQYMIADKASGEKVPFSASERIEPYVNQTVELTGKVMERGGQKVFQPESVKRVSNSCEGQAGGQQEQR